MSEAASDTTRYARVKALFLDALDQPPDGRPSWLDIACDDPAIRAEVDALLAAHERADDDDVLARPVLDRTPFGDVPAPDGTDYWSGRMVGPWRLVERIGEGGMGTVYRAERADGTYTRTVAVKLLRPGAHHASLAQRLQAEQQILARLEHPGIAHFYDGGFAQDGLPYFVMELVEGEALTAYADGEQLGLEARLRLFVQVCDAVAYAHRNLVVHRDLKPSNILVSADGTVKLLDFGIARLLEEDETDALRTRTSIGAMTPAYAAPEQVLGRSITTATDVYALGVVLYELLTDRRPYDLTGRTPAEIERIITETEPARPSAVVAAEPVHYRLEGDLDTIVGKALAKEPERRYPSADAFADDLRRHLDALPVLARPATPGYRLRTFTRRHRLGVAASAALLLALLGGLGTTLWQASEAAAERDLAERRFETARAAARALIFDVHDAVETLPGSTPVREVIVTQARDYLDRLAQDAGDDDALRLDLAQAYLRVGNVQGNPNNSNLGHIQEALASYRHGLSVLPTSVASDSLRLDIRHVRAVLLEKLGDIHAHLGQPDTALVYIDRALALFQQNAEADPDNPGRQIALAIEHLKRGDYTGNPNHPNAGRPAEALEYYRTTLALLDAIVGEDSVRVARLAGMSYERQGSIYATLGDAENARAAYRQSLAIRERLAAAYPFETDIQRDVAIAHEKLGLTAQADGRLNEARTELEAAYAGYQALLDADPQDVHAQITLAIGAMQRGALMASPEGPSFRNPAAARSHYREALRLLREAAAIDESASRVQALIEEAEQALASL